MLSKEDLLALCIAYQKVTKEQFESLDKKLTQKKEQLEKDLAVMLAEAQEKARVADGIATVVKEEKAVVEVENAAAEVDDKGASLGTVLNLAFIYFCF